MQFQDSEYARLKNEIDKLIMSGIHGAELEIKKGAILKKSDPYLDFLSAAAGKPRDTIVRYIDELSSDNRFFEKIAPGLDLIEERATAGLQTGELRVHIYTDYVLVRALVPETMVETGVCNGKSSAFVLNAMEHNRKGHLYSVDLPTREEDDNGSGEAITIKGRQTGWLVPEEFKSRWSLHLGPAQEVLPKLRPTISKIDIFQHDSLHTYEHMNFEIELAKDWVRPGGLILVDDIRANNAFEEQSEGETAAAFSAFGFIRKPS